MTTFAARLRALYAAHPDKVAIVLQHTRDEDLPITYAKLLGGAEGFAHALAEAGVQPGDVVVLILQHGRALIDAYFGAVLRGAIPSIMPFLTEKLSPERYRADLHSLITITRPAAIVTYREFDADLRAAVDDSEPALIMAEDIAPRAVEAAHWTGLSRAPDDIALLQHSSGTTGLQKGVVLSHQAVFNQLDSYTRVLQTDKDDVIVSWLPLYHDMGLIAGFLLPILYDIQLVLMSPFDWVRAPQRLLHSVSKYRGTLTWLPNFAYNFSAHKIRDRHLDGVDLSSWRAIINCSEPVRWESHAAFLERFVPYGLRANALHTSYATAENVFAVTQSTVAGGPKVQRVEREAFFREHVIHESSNADALALMSSGVPLPNVQIKIIDDAGRECVENVIGEIVLHSDCMLTEYYHRPDATAQALRDGWYLTGDLGFTSEGELFVTGRRKDLIIVGGKNVYPQDLEQLAHDVPGVHRGRAVAFGIFDDEQGTEEVVIVAEAELDDATRFEELADAIRSYVTKNSAVTLRHVKVVGPQWIIKTSSGKAARGANKEKYVAELKN